MTRDDITAFVFARGGSKGIRNKNIRSVGGKPLLAHTIHGALASRSVSRVIVSTDSEQIADVATQFGAEVLRRPAELADDDAPEILSWRHAIAANPDVFAGPRTPPFVSLPATSPLRAPDDVDRAIDRLDRGDCDIVFGITPSHRSPYLNMVTVGADGFVHIVTPGSSATRRQDVPAVYDITTCVYVARVDYVTSTERLMDGRVGHVVIPPQRALDIDEPFDLHLAHLLLTHPFPEEAS